MNADLRFRHILDSRRNICRFNKLDPSYGISHLVEGIKDGIGLEMDQMSQVIIDNKYRADLERILAKANQFLKSIETSWRQGEISPESEVVCSSYDLLTYSENRKLRVGFYPLAANPIHWGHILIGLSAMSKFKLDKVIYVVAGFDERKPNMISAEMRHLIAQEVLDIFAPLFSYSSMALDSTLDGETNMFKFLQMNNQQAMEVVYLVGSDHYCRKNSFGEKDTILKIEEALASIPSENSHQVSVAFIERGARPAYVQTDLMIDFLEPVPVEISSTMIRHAFEYSCMGDLVGLPYTAYDCIRTLDLYPRNTKSNINN